MMNPLLDNPTDLTDAELSDKINTAYERMRFFEGMCNTGAYQQAYNLYLIFQDETRMRAARRYASTDDDFSDKIDIKK